MLVRPVPIRNQEKAIGGQRCSGAYQYSPFRSRLPLGRSVSNRPWCTAWHLKMLSHRSPSRPRLSTVAIVQNRRPKAQPGDLILKRNRPHSQPNMEGVRLDAYRPERKLEFECEMLTITSTT